MKVMLLTCAIHWGCGSLSTDEPDRIFAVGPGFVPGAQPMPSATRPAPAAPRLEGMSEMAASPTEILAVEDDGPVEDVPAYGSAAVSDDAAILVDGRWTSTSSAPIAYVFRRGSAGWALAGWLDLSEFDATRTRVSGNAVSISISGDRVLVGAPTENGYRGAYILSIGDTTDVPIDLVVERPIASDDFGAAVSLSGDTALVAAPGHEGGRGAVYVFERSTHWAQTSLLSAPDGQNGELFGHTVSLSGDTALVGAGVPALGRGNAYLFEREGSDWVLNERFSAAAAGRFSHSVCVSGNRAVIGSPDRGVALIFQRGPEGWGEPVELSVEERVTSLSLSGDNLLIGSALYDGNRGAAYVFHRDAAGWARWATLADPVAMPPRGLGSFVSMSGETGLIVGATFERVEGHVFSLSDIPRDASNER